MHQRKREQAWCTVRVVHGVHAARLHSAGGPGKVRDAS